MFDLSPTEILARLAIIAIAFPLHEYAHAWAAFKLGDLTAYMQGRLTLDPRQHIDPIGALMVLFAGFGWARPVPIDPYRLGRRGVVLVSLAGPLSNLALAVAVVLAMQGLILLAPSSQLATGLRPGLEDFLFWFASINVILLVFNLLPLAPLDGWKVLLGLAPPSTAFQLQQSESYSTMALFLVAFGIPVVFHVNWLYDYIFQPALQLFWGIFGYRV